MGHGGGRMPQAPLSACPAPCSKAWMQQGRLNCARGMQISPHRLDFLLPKVGHDGVVTLEGVVVMVALE